MFLLPSKYEPCGLGQLIAMKYGTVPAVHKTGGLADTVMEFNLNNKMGNGFVFEVYLPNELISALKRALNLYNDGKSWKNLMSNCMKLDFSWKESAKKYLELFKKLKSEI
jgi:starch synthase